MLSFIFRHPTFNSRQPVLCRIIFPNYWYVTLYNCRRCCRWHMITFQYFWNNFSSTIFLVQDITNLKLLTQLIVIRWKRCLSRRHWWSAYHCHRTSPITRYCFVGNSVRCSTIPASFHSNVFIFRLPLYHRRLWSLTICCRCSKLFYSLIDILEVILTSCSCTTH